MAQIFHIVFRLVGEGGFRSFSHKEKFIMPTSLANEGFNRRHRIRQNKGRAGSHQISVTALGAFHSFFLQKGFLPFYCNTNSPLCQQKAVLTCTQKNAKIEKKQRRATVRRVLLNFLNNIEDFCPEDMIEDATDPMQRLCGYFENTYGCDEGVERLFGILSTPMKISGYVGEKQNYFLTEVMSMRIVDRILNNYLLRLALSPSAALSAIRAYPAKVRSDLAFVLICLCGVDHDITSAERSFLYDVINLV